jgi:hypothetical protein
VVKQNGPPRRTIILLKFTVVSSFEEWSVLEVDAGQTFLEGYTFSPGYTLFSVGGMAQGGGMVRKVIPRGKTHSLQVTLCLVLDECPRVGNSPGSTIRDSHSLGQIHSLQVTLCLVSEEWPRVRNGPNIS